MPLQSPLERNVRGDMAAKVRICPRSQMKDSALFSLHAEGWTDWDSNPIGDGLQHDSSLLPRTLFLLGHVLVFMFHLCLWIASCLCDWHIRPKLQVFLRLAFVLHCRPISYRLVLHLPEQPQCWNHNCTFTTRFYQWNYLETLEVVFWCRCFVRSVRLFDVGLITAGRFRKCERKVLVEIELHLCCFGDEVWRKLQ